jgi:choice-of-anchor A domain-containing protein
MRFLGFLALVCASVVSGTRYISPLDDGSSLVAAGVGTRPLTCEEIEQQIAFQTTRLPSRQAARALVALQASQAAVCASTTPCPLLVWSDIYPGAFVEGNFNAPSSDVEFSLYVGGNASLVGYSVGEKFDIAGASVVVGGDLKWHTGRVIRGNVVYGGEAAIGSPVLNGLVEGQKVLQDTDVWDWNIVSGYFAYVSSYLKNLGGAYSTGSFLRGPKHSLTCETLNKLHIIEIESDDVVVVNVVGPSCRLSNIEIRTKSGCENCLLNFDATELFISEAQIPCSVVAPQAAVVGSSGVINGQLIAASFSGSTQINHCQFVGCPAELEGFNYQF